MGAGSSKARARTDWYKVHILDKDNDQLVQATGRIKVTSSHMTYTDDRDEYVLPLQNIIRHSLTDDVLTVEISKFQRTSQRAVYSFKSDSAKTIFKEIDRNCRQLAKGIAKSTERMMKGVSV
ncbi:uncharacterized protein LOC102801763 [Saccoglossus kowalevskii]|uniref:Uncharacterized protein LOC102801763 n=1 Tax=Saccoglossus kowalevskii TaxID=10224 RepID=A0ABM0MMG8_SACKO|nr:PREDICTED: uncharacterized protein LOC102801763 [Saccoglossus kowalevskii]